MDKSRSAIRDGKIKKIHIGTLPFMAEGKAGQVETKGGLKV
jgi:hypothetical protein